MVAPQPRVGDAPPPGMDASTWQVLSALGRLQDGQDATRASLDGFRTEVVQRFDRLPETFVTLREHEQFAHASERDRALLHAEDQRLDGKIDASRDALAERLEAVERERKSDRHWALGLLATILIALAGFGVTVIVHYL